MIKKNIRVAVQNPRSTIPVFEVGRLQIDIMFWPGGGVDIKSMVYNREMRIYNIVSFRDKATDYQTLKEFIFEIYRKQYSYNPSGFLQKKIVKRITEFFSQSRIWIEKEDG